MPVRKLQSYEVDYQEELSQQVPRYQDYTPEAQSDANLKEILFLLISLFFVSVLLSLVLSFLALKLSAAVCICRSNRIQLLVLKIQRSIIKRKRRR